MKGKNESLKPRLTDEFLATLVETAKCVGWGVDYTEVQNFVREVFHLAERPEPTKEMCEPYPVDDNEDDF
jgi:hypothetical protein